jgi:hypothetical protein
LFWSRWCTTQPERCSRRATSAHLRKYLRFAPRQDAPFRSRHDERETVGTNTFLSLGWIDTTKPETQRITVVMADL